VESYDRVQATPGSPARWIADRSSIGRRRTVRLVLRWWAGRLGTARRRGACGGLVWQLNWADGPSMRSGRESARRRRTLTMVCSASCVRHPTGSRTRVGPETRQTMAQTGSWERPSPKAMSGTVNAKTSIVHMSTVNQMSALLCTHPASPQVSVHATLDIDKRALRSEVSHFLELRRMASPFDAREVLSERTSGRPIRTPAALLPGWSAVSPLPVRQLGRRTVDETRPHISR